MEEQDNRIPIQMDFTIASITEGIEYWLNNVVLKESISVDKITWKSDRQFFIVTIKY